MKIRNVLPMAATIVVASYAGQVLAQEGPGINQPPSAVDALLAPAAGEINGLDASFPKFTWTAKSTATKYQVYIAREAVGGTGVKTIDVDASAACTSPVDGVCSANMPNALGNMPDGASYRWWVGAANAFSPAGTYTWSTPSSFSYALVNDIPTALSAAQLLSPVGNAETTRTQFQWENSSTASWFRVLVTIQDSGFGAGPGKWVTAADAGCTLAGTGLATCSTDYAGHVGKSEFKDYCFTITPYNSKGLGAKSPEKCFYNTTN